MIPSISLIYVCLEFFSHSPCTRDWTVMSVFSQVVKILRPSSQLLFSPPLSIRGEHIRFIIFFFLPHTQIVMGLISCSFREVSVFGERGRSVGGGFKYLARWADIPPFAYNWLPITPISSSVSYIGTYIRYLPFLYVRRGFRTPIAKPSKKNK